MIDRNNADRINEQSGYVSYKAAQKCFLIALLQTIFILFAVWLQFGYVYVLFWLGLLHLFLARHYLLVWAGSTEVWISQMMDYPVFLFACFFAPLLAALCILNFYVWPQDFLNSFYSNNLDFTRRLKEIDFLNIPKNLKADSAKDVIILYSYTLAILSSTVCASLSAVFWWSMSNRWLWHVKNMALAYRAWTFLGLVMGIYLCSYAAYSNVNGYGYKLMLVHIDGQTFKGLRYSDAFLFKQTARWMAHGPTCAMVASGLLSFFRFIHFRIQFKKG